MGLLQELESQIRNAVNSAFIDGLVEAAYKSFPADQVFYSENISLEKFEGEFPQEISLCRLYILKAGQSPKVERHVNSTQILTSYRGAGSIKQFADSEEKADQLNSQREGNIESRWSIVEANTWHQPNANPGEDWVTITFHTAPADEIIDEYK